MMLTTDARIFLATDRGLTETSWFRSQPLFNFGAYRREGREPFGDLYLMNDETIAGGRSIQMMVEEDTWVVLLPVIGAIQYKDESGKENIIAAGQVQTMLLSKGSSYAIANPFKEELVNFQQLWIRAKSLVKGESCLSTYDVNEFANTVSKISAQELYDHPLPFKLSIGKFSGRGETIYYSKENGVMLLVLEGVFEVAGRLLHAGDALSLTGMTEIDMEALSNDAIILLVELTVNDCSF